LLVRITSITLSSLYDNQYNFIYRLTFQSGWYLGSLILTLGLSFIFIYIFDIQLRFASLFRLYFVSRAPYLLVCLIELIYLLVTHTPFAHTQYLSLIISGVLFSSLYLWFLNRHEGYLTTKQNLLLVIATNVFQLFGLIPDFLEFFS